MPYGGHLIGKHKHGARAHRRRHASYVLHEPVVSLLGQGLALS